MCLSWVRCRASNESDGFTSSVSSASVDCIASFKCSSSHPQHTRLRTHTQQQLASRIAERRRAASHEFIIIIYSLLRFVFRHSGFVVAIIALTVIYHLSYTNVSGWARVWVVDIRFTLAAAHAGVCVCMCFSFLLEILPYYSLPEWSRLTSLFVSIFARMRHHSWNFHFALACSAHTFKISQNNSESKSPNKFEGESRGAHTYTQSKAVLRPRNIKKSRTIFDWNKN